jgi:hypothetical protein
MAIKRFFATKDTTITNAFKQNLITRATASSMGASDVLEVFSIYAQADTGSLEATRALIQFDISELSASRDAGNIPVSGSVDFFLRLYNAKHTQTLPKDYTLEILPISASWDEGTGLDMEEYKDVGASNWISSSNDVTWSTEGGDYHTGTKFTQSFNGTDNLEIDISPLVEKWLIGSSGAGSGDGTGFTNYGVGIKLVDSQELTQSGDDERSYYTKKFFARGTEYFFKKPNIEARWDSSKSDQRGNFFYSSSLASGADNLNSIYLYNFVRGQLKDIPDAGTGKESIYVQIFSGTLHNNGPSTFALTPTADGVHVNSHTPTVITGAYISTGIYSASFALTATSTPLTYLFDVWYTGSTASPSAGGTKNYYTGTIKPYTLEGSNINPTNKYVSSLLDLKSIYDDEENPKLRLFVRDKDWCPSVYTKVKKELPTKIIEDAFYKVIRVEDNLEVIPYGTGSTNLKYTKMSYDISGSYFDLEMQLLEPGYMYEFKFLYYVNGAYHEQPESFRFRVEKNEH